MPATSCAASFTLFMTVVEMLWIWSGFLVVKRVYNHQSAKEHYYSNMIMMMTIILIVHKSKKLKIRRIQLLTETSVLYQWYYLNTSTTATTKYIYTYIYIIANPPNDIIETTYYTIIQDTYNINYSIFINTWTNLMKMNTSTTTTISEVRPLKLLIFHDVSFSSSMLCLNIPPRSRKRYFAV